jgi:hypothetical protein
VLEAAANTLMLSTLANADDEIKAIAVIKKAAALIFSACLFGSYLYYFLSW